nr:PorV/PorQ family protein [uncultured Prevotella sp.]
MNKISMALVALGSFVTMEVTAQSRILPILEANPDVRSEAMGSTLLGNTNQMFIYTNPAALSLGETRFAVDASLEAQAMTNEGRPMQYNLATGYRFDNRSALMAGMRYYGGLNVPKVGSSNKDHYLSPNDFTLDLAYSFTVTENIAVYTSATYAHSQAATSTNALTFSLGGAYQKPIAVSEKVNSVLTLGVRLMDFGKSVKFDDTGIPYSLPTSLVVGGDWQVDVSPKHRLTYALSARHFTPKETKETLVGTGLEYTYNKMLSARVGYQCAEKTSNAFTLGAGGQLKHFKVDIAYQHSFAYYGIDAFMVHLGYRL